MRRIFVVGTADTKGEELAFLAAEIRAAGGKPLLVDVGIKQATVAVDVTAEEVAAFGVAGLLGERDRGTAVAGMALAFAAFIITRDDISGIVGIGGGGGTSIVTAGMRRLPIGVPKIMVSTLASGDVAPYVGVSDIVMMPSVTDLAGLNRISRVILSNAAQAIVAMSAHPARVEAGRPAVGLTMFGVTTRAVTQIVEGLGNAVEPIVFHATGAGGKSLEMLVNSGLIGGVIDLTTTEVADYLVGGVLPAGPERFDSVIATGVPCVASVGACDMVNFWARETVPERFDDRLFYKHNDNVTLMRTTPEECQAIGAWIGDKLRRCEGPLRFLIPEKGISALDIDGGPFRDPEADAALFSAIERALGPERVIRLPYHINDRGFAAAVVAAFNEISAQEKAWQP